MTNSAFKHDTSYFSYTKSNSRVYYHDWWSALMPSSIIRLPWHRARTAKLNRIKSPLLSVPCVFTAMRKTTNI